MHGTESVIKCSLFFMSSFADSLLLRYTYFQPVGSSCLFTLLFRVVSCSNEDKIIKETKIGAERYGLSRLSACYEHRIGRVKHTLAGVAQVLKTTFWCWRSRVQFLGRSNRTRCRQRLATAATFLQSCVAQMPKRSAAEVVPATRYTLLSNNASVMNIFIQVTNTFEKQPVHELPLEVMSAQPVQSMDSIGSSLYVVCGDQIVLLSLADSGN